MVSRHSLDQARRRLLSLTMAGLLVGAAFFLGPASAQESSTLTVVVQGIENAQGKIRIAIWDDQEHFTEGDYKLASGVIKAQAGQVEFVFEGLRPGPYAMATYHDEDDDNDFDQTWIGLPAEGLGFSNGAWIGLGPPSFDEAAVQVSPGPQTTTITLRY